jgi:4-diphosphocytidyl-2-C-methyl-D-erythritol kinase
MAAGGMSGHSANAAGVLVAMKSRWDLRLPRGAVHMLAAQLGSDVPFALQGGAALGTGRGEELTIESSPNAFHWMLAFAVTGLSTPEVFRPA